jgi:serine/threonine-protein kinase
LPAAYVGLVGRLHSAAALAPQVSHPIVCRVYDIGEAEGLAFLTMEYVDWRRPRVAAAPDRAAAGG